MANRECKDCQETKPLEGGFYKYGTERQYYYKRCRACHNKCRYDYKRNPSTHPKVYKKRGFRKLPKDLQAKIISMIGDGKPILAVYNAVKDDHDDLRYTTMLSWHKKGTITNEPASGE